MNEAKRFFLGMTGASGAVYGQRCLQVLGEAGHKVDLAMTDAAFKVIRHELGIELNPEDPRIEELVGEAAAENIRWYPNDAIESPPSSGTFKEGGAVIIPCSMGTLGRAAHGYSSCLVERCCDVALKEGRPLVLVPRETPLNQIHLRNMYRMARAGATILPAMPGFYHQPGSINDLVNHVVTKVLDALGLDKALIQRWGEDAR